MSLMTIASPQRGEVGGGNYVGSDLAAARAPAAPPPTWPPPAGGRSTQANTAQEQVENLSWKSPKYLDSRFLPPPSTGAGEGGGEAGSRLHTPGYSSPPSQPSPARGKERKV